MNAIERIAYDYLQYVDPVGTDTTTELHDQLIEGLIEAETYPGEAFSVFVEPDVSQIFSEFMADVGVNSTDIVSLVAPSTQTFDDLFYTLYREMSDGGAIISTKYPYRDIRTRVKPTDPFIIDCTPNSNEATTRKESESGVSHVTCGDLTNVGVAVERAFEQMDCNETERVLGLSTISQLLAHHSRSNIERFLHEITGRCRNRNIGAVIHTGDGKGLNSNQNIGVEHADYSIEFRIQNQTISGRVFGKRDIKTQWKKIGVVSSSRGDRGSLPEFEGNGQNRTLVS